LYFVLFDLCFFALLKIRSKKGHSSIVQNVKPSTRLTPNRANTALDPLERNLTKARFAFTAPMIWDYPAKREASLANLVNEALRIRRMRKP
jgi:hypothetical protein